MSRRFRICMAKGGRESLRSRYGRSKLTLISSQKKNLKRCFAKPFGHNFQNSALSLNQWYFDIYEIPLIQWPGLILKIAVSVNAGNSRSTGISQLRAGKTLSKKARSHFLSQRRFSPMYTGLSSFYGPSQYFSSYLSWRLKSKKIHFSRISIASCKKIRRPAAGSILN